MLCSKCKQKKAVLIVQSSSCRVIGGLCEECGFYSSDDYRKLKEEIDGVEISPELLKQLEEEKLQEEDEEFEFEFDEEEIDWSA